MSTLTFWRRRDPAERRWFGLHRHHHGPERGLVRRVESSDGGPVHAAIEYANGTLDQVKAFAFDPSNDEPHPGRLTYLFDDGSAVVFERVP
jgi:hypothetical protein